MSTEHTSQRKSRTLPWLITLLLVGAAASSTGCSRTFYRRQADIDAYGLVREKATHPHWRLENYTISVDPRSRMYDPYSIDCPPIPPDDPTAHELMHCVDHKRGWPFWHDNGERPFVENPAWPEYIEIDERGVVKLSAEDAVRLALLHSRTYQTQVENLYLSALDVSAERFDFDTQFFAGYNVFASWLGRDARGTNNGQSESNLQLNTASDFNNTSWQMRRNFSTGSTLIVNFANQLMWQFSGPDDYRGTSLIDFALFQPLLRDAGRERILEVLTLSERALLANVRSMEQYRQGFYVNVMTGGQAGDGPQRVGGVTGGSGLGGFSGLGAGGFGQLGGGGGGAAGGAGGATAGGTGAAGQRVPRPAPGTTTNSQSGRQRSPPAPQPGTAKHPTVGATAAGNRRLSQPELASGTSSPGADSHRKASSSISAMLIRPISTLSRSPRSVCRRTSAWSRRTIC